MTIRLRGRVRMIDTGRALLLQLGSRTARISPFDEADNSALHTLRRGEPLPESPAWVEQLVDAGFCEEVTERNVDGRHERLLDYLSEFETPAHDRFALLDRLRTAHVVVIGLGGLSSWTVYHLVCCGVGRLTLLDGDVVEASNLNRSILYRERDVGRPKVEAARDAVLDFAPKTRIDTVRMLVEDGTSLQGLLDGADVVVGLADQPPWLIKQWIARAAVAARVPVLQASGSRVGPFRTDADAACAMCDWSAHVERRPEYPSLLARQLALPTGSSGALSPFGGITGGFAALQVFRFLLGRPVAVRDRVWELAADLTANYRSVPRHPQCGVCSGSGSPLPLPDTARTIERTRP